MLIHAVFWREIRVMCKNMDQEHYHVNLDNQWVIYIPLIYTPSFSCSISDESIDISKWLNNWNIPILEWEVLATYIILQISAWITDGWKTKKHMRIFWLGIIFSINSLCNLVRKVMVIKALESWQNTKANDQKDNQVHHKLNQTNPTFWTQVSSTRDQKKQLQVRQPSLPLNG